MYPTDPVLRLTVLLFLLTGSSAVAETDKDRPNEAELHPSCPDPAVIRDPERRDFYVFGTGHGIPVWRSDDLRSWRRVGRVFPDGIPQWAREAIPKAGPIWAPDVSHFSGKFHLYYAVSTFGSQRSVIGLAVNQTLDTRRTDYAWQDRGLVIESKPGECDFNAIDPALFVDRDGQPYLFWGSYWSGIKAMRISKETGKPASQPPEILPIAARSAGTDPPSIEAPFVVFRDGYYYLFVSWDFCCAGLNSDYKIIVGRSKSVVGPYVDDRERRMLDGYGNLVLSSSSRWRGTGHNSVLQTAEGDWLVYACYDERRPAAQRVLNVRPLQWKSGWPVVADDPTRE